MRTPVLAPLSAVSATITLVLCSFVIAPSAPAQDSCSPCRRVCIHAAVSRGERKLCRV